MAKYKVLIILIILTSMLTYNSYCQGCSDAGVCTMNSFKQHNENSINQSSNRLKFGFSYGKADYSINIIGNYFEYNKQINNKFGVDIKYTAISQTGNDISKYGLADAFLNINYKAIDNIIFTLGTKVPLSKSNKSLNNLPLPMDYQSTLGTYDIIFGIGYEFNKLHIVAAIQQPITQNDNKFIAEKYPEGSKLREFQSTNQFKRSGDVLLRVSYPVSLTEKLIFTTSILPIYHLYNDKYIDLMGKEREIVGSKGVTLNGNVFLDYEIITNQILQLSFGVPFIIREARPDGLTRSFISNLEYRYSF